METEFGVYLREKRYANSVSEETTKFYEWSHNL